MEPLYVGFQIFRNDTAALRTHILYGISFLLREAALVNDLIIVDVGDQLNDLIGLNAGVDVGLYCVECIQKRIEVSLLASSSMALITSR